MAKETWQERLEQARAAEAALERKPRVDPLPMTEEAHDALRVRKNGRFRKVITQRRVQ